MNTLLLITGMWRAVLSLPDGELPFNFELKENNHQVVMTIINGEEKIVVDEISQSADSLFIRLPLFDAEIRVKILEKTMSGDFINYSRKTNQRISFRAEQGISYRFKEQTQEVLPNRSGRWETNFSPGIADSSKAIGVFYQKENGVVTGTFLTPSGDYRFLEGCVTRDSLFLSCFDGSHAFLFMARVSENEMNGVFLSGNHSKENFTAIKNEKYTLPDPYTLTFLKKGYDRLDFSLPDLDSNLVSLKDDRFKNKVVLVQIMGSWCPNCMDESAFFSKVYNQYHAKGLEIVGIAFEKTVDFSKSVSNVKRLKDKYHITYPLVIAKRDSVAQTLPMITKIMGYPTTIYIDKKGMVRKIYTGFSGPATGNEYMKYKEDFGRLVEKLLLE